MKDYFYLAFNNLKRRKLRSWLTMIGIFIGIAAVVALISLGQGLQNYIGGEFEKLGKDKIIIQPKSLGSPGSTGTASLILREKDLNFIQNINGVDWGVGMLYKVGKIEFKQQSKITYIVGIDPEDIKKMSEIQSFGVGQGRWIESGDQHKAVIGYLHAHGDIWERNIEIGDRITIEGEEFKVVGIVEQIGNNYDDSQIYIPKDALKNILNIQDEESMIMVKVASSFNPENIANTIKRKLRQFRGEKEGQETFEVQTSQQLLKTFQSIFAVVQAVLVGIAGISLLVGGIGIMNTMYTAVIERTKEIGTMKAIGAKNSDVLLIFLFESGLLGLVGGSIGILIGLGLAKIAEYAATQAIGVNLLQAAFPPYLIIGALMFSFLIGSLSGILPAMQASKLKPAEALRYE